MRLVVKQIWNLLSVKSTAVLLALVKHELRFVGHV